MHRYQRRPPESRAKIWSSGRSSAASVPRISWPCSPQPISSYRSFGRKRRGLSVPGAATCARGGFSPLICPITPSPQEPSALPGPDCLNPVRPVSVIEGGRGPLRGASGSTSDMTPSSLASLLDLELTPGEPPLVRADAGMPDGAGAANWVTGHRTALRAAVAEHGCVLVRGLGLRDVAGTGAVVRRLAVRLMDEKEAFAPRRPLTAGPESGTLYSATPWPP